MKQDITKTNQRIGFIDLMRTYAILMMVQGHLTESLLDRSLIAPDNIIYAYWNFFRGITAPVFFFSSGLVFSYLLFEADKVKRSFSNPRVIKGIKRGLFLIFVGYLLQINSGFFEFLLTGEVSLLRWFFAVHVLHTIGISLILMIFTYLLFNKFNHWSIFFIIGNFIFLVYPQILNIDWNSILPIPFANYFTRVNGSIFTLSPWIGFSFLGASLGIAVSRYRKHINTLPTFVIILAIGLVLHFASSGILLVFYEITGLELFDWLGRNNFIYYRLGQVLIIAGIAGVIDKTIKIPNIITVLSRETLMIYIAHSIVIYGWLTTFGLTQIFGSTLTGWQCLYMAIAVEMLMIIIAYNGNRIRSIMYFWRKSKT